MAAEPAHYLTLSLRLEMSTTRSLMHDTVLYSLLGEKEK